MTGENQPVPSDIHLLTISQSIIAAHDRHFEREEALLREIRDQPKHFLDIARYQDMERRVGVLEEGVRDLSKQIMALPDQLMQRLEAKTNMSRGHIITVSIAIANGFVAIALGVITLLLRR